MAITNISLFICQHDKLAEFPFSMANVEVVQTAPERVLRIGCLDQIILSTVFDTSHNIFFFQPGFALCLFLVFHIG